MDKHSIIAKDMMEGVKGYTLPSLTIKTSALQEFSTLSSELTSARKKINEESIRIIIFRLRSMFSKPY